VPTALLTAAALIAAAVVWVVLPKPSSHQEDAGTPAHTPAAGRSPSSGSNWDGSRFGPLTRLLAPTPDGFTAGPDVPGLGAHTEITGAQYEQFELSQFPGLGASARRQLAGLMDSQHVSGVAVRSYTGSGLLISIELTQESRSAASAASKLMGLLRHAWPGAVSEVKVSGYPKAVCVEPKPTGDSKLDSLGSLECTAAVGGVLVQMEEDGPAPLATGPATDLLKQQLDRVAVPDQES
jgi:hypothetical protein